MNKILEALGKILPEEQVKTIASAVEEVLKEAKTELETEFNGKLEEAYSSMSDELKSSEQTGEKGYQEAYSIIEDLRNRLETQRAEFDTSIDEGYEEAYQMLLAERGKNDTVETDLYDQYDKKLSEMRDYMINMIDKFLRTKGQDIYEQARRDIINDPRMVEHKLTLDKVVETVSEYISDEEYTLATSNKLQNLNKENEELKGRLRMLEARNIRLSTDKGKLDEQVRHAQGLLKETKEVQIKEEKKERIEKGKNVAGRGQTAPAINEIAKEKLVPEYKESKADAADETMLETMDEDALHSMQVLSGIKKS